jgi:uncharacterized membrane protein
VRPSTTDRAVEVATSATETKGRRAWRPQLGAPATGRLLLAALVTGAVLRLWHLGARRLGFDEAFTAMTARRPVGSMLAFLRNGDSHPPLDYLLRAPFARAGSAEFFIRFPSAVCSVAALALFAIWMRRNGRVGVLAVALMAVSAFQIAHGREARMYAPLELLGVAAAFTADSWLRHPRRWHAPIIGALAFLGLLTHVSMFLLGAGLLVVAGTRTDREAWRWRTALSLGLVGWAVVWGPSFLVQARSGHSSWIPPTDFATFTRAVGGLVTSGVWPQMLAVLAYSVAGVVLWRRDASMARTWTACFVIAVVVAAVVGIRAPLLIDRSLTVVSWGALFAVAVVVDALWRAVPTLGAIAAAGVIALSIVATAQLLSSSSSADIAIRHLEAVATRGDSIAIYPAHRRPEIAWSLAVARGMPARSVELANLPRVHAIILSGAAVTGRTWLLDWRHQTTIGAGLPHCAPDWRYGHATVECLQTALR